MKTKLILTVFCFTLLFSVINDSQPVFAYNATKAIQYADTYALHPNSYVYRTFSSDCTNYVSQILYAGGVSQSDDWYYNNGVSYSKTWAVADDFKWYIKDVYHATRLASGWCKSGKYHGSTYLYPYIDNSSNIPNTGRTVIFYDWNDDGRIDHSAYCVGTGYSTDENVYADLINQHSTNRYRTRWHLDSHNNNKTTTAIYAFGL